MSDDARRSGPDERQVRIVTRRVTAGAEERRVDVGDLTLAWGDAARWKARLREESQQAFEELPIGERLRRALAMVARRTADGGGR